MLVGVNKNEVVRYIVKDDRESGDYEVFSYVDMETTETAINEAKEFLISWNENELADLSEVIRALSEVIGSSPEQVEFERQKKAQERGGFFEGIVLDEA